MPESNKFLKGKLLLDSGQLRGSFFQRTVVPAADGAADTGAPAPGTPASPTG